MILKKPTSSLEKKCFSSSLAYGIYIPMPKALQNKTTLKGKVSPVKFFPPLCSKLERNVIYATTATCSGLGVSEKSGMFFFFFYCDFSYYVDMNKMRKDEKYRFQ